MRPRTPDPIRWLPLVSALIAGACSPEVANECAINDECGAGEVCAVGGVCARSDSRQLDAGRADAHEVDRDGGVPRDAAVSAGDAVRPYDASHVAADTNTHETDSAVDRDSGSLVDGSQSADANVSTDTNVSVDMSVLDARVDAVQCTDEFCDGQDNDCDGRTDEGVQNACGSCGAVPVEACDGQDNDCDGQSDEGVLNACNACGPIEAAEVCDGVDQNCDDQVDENAPCPIFEACREGRCQEAPLVFEAEGPAFQHNSGRPEDGRWCGVPSPNDLGGHIVHGPYAGLPQGRLVATFWLLVGDDAGLSPETNYGRLEIIDADQNDQQLQGRGYPILRNAFGAPQVWQPFVVPFDSPGQGHRIAFRVWWERQFYLCVDRIDVSWAR